MIPSVIRHTTHCLLLTFLLLLSASIRAEGNPCDQLIIIKVRADATKQGDYLLSIRWDAGSNQFLNYPKVTVLRDCKGDTVATGDMFSFGHLGSTAQDYPVTLTGKGSIDCYPLTATFVSNNSTGSTDTCTLVFGTIDVRAIDEFPVTLSPNPVDDMLVVTSSSPSANTRFVISDITGRVMLEGTTVGPTTRINTTFLVPGAYIISCGSEHPTMFVIGTK